ncbi:hypothetical protein MD484_g1368, partial [Candolleomyces efflorescens]
MTSYTSPFLQPQSYIRDVNRFSAEGIAIDEAVGRAARQTAEFSYEYLSGWPLVSSHDPKDDIARFNEEEHPSKKYHLDATPGPKKVFEQIEGLVTKEGEHVVQVLHDEKDWHKGIAELKRNLRNVQRGVQQIRGSLNSYATKLV